VPNIRTVRYKRNVSSQRIAVKAGLLAAGTMVSHVKASGESYEDFRFAIPG
jgi:roadblock/LC7 domain-containing protein